MNTNPKELLLVGCVHGDPAGFRKLFNLLNLEKPDRILLEISPWGIYWRVSRRHLLSNVLKKNLAEAAHLCSIPYKEALKHPAIKAIQIKLSLPYEYRAAKSYALATGIPIVPVDTTLHSFNHTSTWTELIDVTNLVTLLEQKHPSMQSLVVYNYRMAKEHFKKDNSHKRNVRTENTGVRELWLTRQAHLQLRLTNANKTVFIGGWEHFLPHSIIVNTLRSEDNTKVRIVLLNSLH